MKKLLILFISLILITGCTKKEESVSLKKYNNYIDELKEVDESSKDIPFDIEINVNEYKNDIISYTSLINRNDLEMYDIEAILIHNIDTTNAFPSTGIFDDKVYFDKNSKEKGIKLTGYVEKSDDIIFKLLIKYKDDLKKEHKYYYVYNFRQENTN